MIIIHSHDGWTLTAVVSVCYVFIGIAELKGTIIAGGGKDGEAGIGVVDVDRDEEEAAGVSASVLVVVVVAVVGVVVAVIVQPTGTTRYDFSKSKRLNTNPTFGSQTGRQFFRWSTACWYFHFSVIIK